jgi:hypothetical protein
MTYTAMTVEHYAIEPQRVMPALDAGIYVFEPLRFLDVAKSWMAV